MHLGMDAKTKLIRKVPLFAQLSKKALDDVAKIADEIDLGEGRVLAQEGARVAVLDLGSRTGTRWKDAPRQLGPLSPRHQVSIGPFRLCLVRAAVNPLPPPAVPILRGTHRSRSAETAHR